MNVTDPRKRTPPNEPKRTRNHDSSLRNGTAVPSLTHGRPYFVQKLDTSASPTAAIYAQLKHHKLNIISLNMVALLLPFAPGSSYLAHRLRVMLDAPHRDGDIRPPG